MNLMTRIAQTTLFAGLMIAAGTALAEDRASKPEAEAMVKKAVALYKTAKDKAFTEFTAPSKSFVSKDLYVVVYDLNGKCLAHGQNDKQVGKDLIALKDPDGKEFVKERVELAKSKGKFWQDYKFTDPMTKKILPKEMYCEKSENVVICSGVYKS